MAKKYHYPETLGGKPRLWVAAREVVRGMASWFVVEGKHKKPSHDGRTRDERLFDSGVFAASELVRRLTKDDELSFAIHEACIWRQRQHTEQELTAR